MIRRAWYWFRAHREEERGAVLILTCISMFAILAAGALGVDLGFTVYGSRQAQAMADTAAADVIQYINAADNGRTNAAVQSAMNTALTYVLQDNHSNALLTVTPMLYENGTYSVPSLGCKNPTPITPGFIPCNAVAVSAETTVPQPFWGGFNSLVGKSGSGLPVGTGCGNTTTGGCGTGCNGNPCFSCPTGGCTSCPTTACYAWLPQATFSIGSYLVNISTTQAAQDGGILGDILGDLGTTANVTAVGWQGLATTNVTIRQLITASSGQLTPSNVMTQPLSALQWLGIWKSAVGTEQASVNCTNTPTPEQCNAYTALGDMSFGSGQPVKLCQLVSVDGSTCSPTNSIPTYEQLSASLNVLGELTTEAELASSENNIDITSALGITGISSAQLSLDLLQAPQVATGAEGSVTTPTSCPVTTGTATCATTSQVQANLQLTVQGVGVVDIPLSAAEGIATLSSVICTTSNTMQNTKITSETQTATATVTLALTGQSAANIATLTFGGAAQTAESYSASVVPPTASTANAATNPVQLGSFDPTPTFTGTTGNWNLVSGLLGGAVADALGPVLQAAGVSVGGADVADLSTDCDAIGITQ